MRMFERFSTHLTSFLFWIILLILDAYDPLRKVVTNQLINK